MVPAAAAETALTLQWGTVIALIGSISGGVWWIAWLISGMARKVDSLVARIEAIEANGYTMAHASENALRRAMANPGIREPDPRHHGKFIIAERGVA